MAKDLKSTDLAVVRKAVVSIEATKSPLAAPLLWKLYETGEGDRRLMALQALGKKIFAVHAERMFKISLSETLQRLRRAASDSLVKMLDRDTAAKRYIRAIDDPVELVKIGRVRAIQQLAHIGGTPTAAKLKSLLNHKEFEVAVAACEGLSVLGDLSNVPTLLPMLNNKHIEIKPAAEDALEMLTGKRFGSNLVKWEQYVEDLTAGRITKAGVDGPDKVKTNEYDQTYQPQYVKPYKVAIDASHVDFAVVFDTTGSMRRLWPKVSSIIDEVIRLMLEQTQGVRVGSVRYRASDPRGTLTYLIKPFAMTRDMDKARELLKTASTGGGSGGLHLGIQHAISSFLWRTNSRKIVIIVGDTTPSGSGLRKAMQMVYEAWKHDKILFHTLFIRTKYHAGNHRPTYRQLAQYGGGRFYEYDRAWSHLVDHTDPKRKKGVTELPADTFKKWLSPLPLPPANTKK